MWNVNDQEYQDVVSEIKRLTRAWVSLMGLGEWTITSVFNRDAIAAGEATAAETHPNWAYMFADIHWNVDVLSSMAQSLEEVVIHELAHILMVDANAVLQMEEVDGRFMLPNNMERVTTLVAKALLRTKDYADTEGLFDEE